MPKQECTFAVGSLVSVADSSSCRWLGLIVNQEAGKRWVERDPCVLHKLSEESGPLLVRVLGHRVTPWALEKSSLPEEEPRRGETVRWEYVQTVSPSMYVVASPDVESIEAFHQHCLTCDKLGMTGATFFHDVELLLEYLKGEKRCHEATSQRERKFYAMFEEVLPR